MAQLVRFGVSMDAELLAAFDRMLAKQGHAHRSEAIRDLVRQALLAETPEQPRLEPQTAALCVVHDQGRCDQQPMRSKAGDNVQIKATLRVALADDTGISVFIVNGRPTDLQQMAGKVLRSQGVRDGQLVPLAAKWD